MRPLYYYQGKAMLSGLRPKPLLLLLLLLVIGYAGCQYAGSNFTPKTVSVRGYVRSDGARISAYHRRPPGSVAHDRPYGQLQIISFVAVSIALAVGCRPIYRFIAAPPLSLLPPLDPTKLPARPVDIEVPKRAATARKAWSCEDCGSEMSAGTRYYYYCESGHGIMTRHRYCGSCSSERYRRKQNLPWLMKEYCDAVAAARREQCVVFYGLPPESFRS